MFNRKRDVMRGNIKISKSVESKYLLNNGSKYKIFIKKMENNHFYLGLYNLS